MYRKDVFARLRKLLKAESTFVGVKQNRLEVVRHPKLKSRLILCSLLKKRKNKQNKNQAKINVNVMTWKLNAVDKDEED